LEIPINILEIAEMLWKCLELTYDFIFHFLQLWLSSRRRLFRNPVLVLIPITMKKMKLDPQPVASEPTATASSTSPHWRQQLCHLFK
jgi:hypothetical protein